MRRSPNRQSAQLPPPFTFVSSSPYESHRPLACEIKREVDGDGEVWPLRPWKVRLEGGNFAVQLPGNNCVLDQQERDGRRRKGEAKNPE